MKCAIVRSTKLFASQLRPNPSIAAAASAESACESSRRGYCGIRTCDRPLAKIWLGIAHIRCRAAQPSAAQRSACGFRTHVKSVRPQKILPRASSAANTTLELSAKCEAVSQARELDAQCYSALHYTALGYTSRTAGVDAVRKAELAVLRFGLRLIAAHDHQLLAKPQPLSVRL